MGAYQTKLTDGGTPETPHFEKYADLYSIDDDPRSPRFSRTPILVEDTSTFFVSTINSGNNIGEEKNPEFCIPEPISPFIRYKMENYGYQDSPETTTTEHLMESSSYKNITEQFQQITLNSKRQDVLSQLDDQATNRMAETNRRIKKSSRHREPNRILKQTLFKNVEENFHENKLTESIEKAKKGEQDRTPLSCRLNQDVLFANDNNIDSENSCGRNQNVSKRKIPSIESSMDKENILVS